MPNLGGTIGKFFPFLRKKPIPDREQTLRSMPVRNPCVEWHTDEKGEAHLHIPRRNDWFAKFLTRILRAPEYREIVLDEIGSEIWAKCDGKTSLDRIIDSTCRKHKLTRRECEISTGAYLKTLAERKLIGLLAGEPVKHGKRKKRAGTRKRP